MFGLYFQSDSNISFLMRSTFARGIYFFLHLFVQNKKLLICKKQDALRDIFFLVTFALGLMILRFLLSDFFSLLAIFKISEFPYNFIPYCCFPHFFFLSEISFPYTCQIFILFLGFRVFSCYPHQMNKPLFEKIIIQQNQRKIHS